GGMNAVNQCVRDAFPGELVRAAAEPNGLAGVGFPHWNGAAAQRDNKHRPLVLVGATELRHFIVWEMTDREASASHGSGGERKRLPGVPHVMQAVSIRALLVLP